MATMSTQTFIEDAEWDLRLAPPDRYVAVRRDIITRAVTEFGDDIAREVNDALPNTFRDLTRLLDERAESGSD